MRASNGPFTITTDYPVTPADEPAGFKPMELLLASLAACTGSVVASLLARLHQPVVGVEVDASGERRDEHPTVFTTITLDFVVHGNGVDAAAVERAIAHADRLCPVLAMLKPGTPIVTSFQIVGE
jgi:putative redox protein